MGFVRWFLTKFSTRAHFMRGIATVIIAVATYQSIKLGKIEDTWLILVGGVMGHYFRNSEKSEDNHGSTTGSRPSDPPEAPSTRR